MRLNSSIISNWFPLLGLGLLVAAFLLTTPYHTYQDYAVSSFKQLSYLETPYLYAYTLIGSILFPFLLSFDRKVHFYTHWKNLYLATLPAAALFILWDVVFTAMGAWGFNDTYLIGARIFGLPIEECLWFFIIPYCCVFIYECLVAYFNPNFSKRILQGISLVLAILFLIIGVLNSDRIYTTLTFTAASLFAFWLYRFSDSAFATRFYLTWLISLIPFMLVNGILTGGFSLEPVVVYSPDAFMGIRLVSIPLEDAFYLWDYLFIILWVYEILKKNHQRGTKERTLALVLLRF